MIMSYNSLLVPYPLTVYHITDLILMITNKGVKYVWHYRSASLAVLVIIIVILLVKTRRRAD